MVDNVLYISLSFSRLYTITAEVATAYLIHIQNRQIIYKLNDVIITKIKLKLINAFLYYKKLTRKWIWF